MRIRVGLVVACGLAAARLVLAASVGFGQTAAAPAAPAAGAPATAAPAAATTGGAAEAKLEFDVATVKPSMDFSSPEAQAAMRAGKMPKFGPNVEGLRAEYNLMQLRDLVAYAYEVKGYQVTGPDTLSGQRFDIMAKMPEGSTAADAPKMMRALLADRFKLEATSKTEDHPVYALIVAKSGPKMKSVPAPPEIDFKAPLQEGQLKRDVGMGPAIMTSSKDHMGMTMNMGSKGVMTTTVKIEGQSFNMHLNFSGVTMPALAAMLSQMTANGPGGGANARPVVDMTGLTGNYDASLDFSPQMNMGGGGGGGGGVGGGAGAAPTASDPGGGAASIYDSVQKMGLKLEPRKAPLQQVVVAHVEKTPTEN